VVYTPESGKLLMYCHHIVNKTDTGCAQSKMGMAYILTKTGTARTWTRRVMGAYLGNVHTFHVNTVIIFLHVTNTRMMSRGEGKLDRLKRESKGAANEAPTCAVPMHAPQTTFLWERVGGVPAEQRVCSGVLKEGTGYNQGCYEKKEN